MPTNDKEYDAERIKILLDDLTNRTRRVAGFVRLEDRPFPSPRVYGTATRAGLLRLGVDIARASQAPETDAVCINPVGLVGAEYSGPIEIVIAPDSKLEEPPPADTASKVGCAIGMALLISVIILAIIGARTVISWIPYCRQA